jgi:hypothetical protein
MAEFSEIRGMKTSFFIFMSFLISSCTTSPVRTPAARFTSSYGWADREQMDIEHLKSIAFKSCQSRYIAPVVEPVPMLDPPRDGGSTAEGMVYQEELAVTTSNLLDQNGFYFTPRPRAAVNRIPMEIFVDPSNSGNYQRKTWEDANPDYSSGIIQPPIDQQALPSAARVLTELIIGHVAPKGDYPQLFNLRSSAYFRFASYPPQVMGATLRLGAHRIFGKGKKDANVREDFPVVRSVFVSTLDNRTARMLVLLESELFCAALTMDMTEGANAETLVDCYWYTREDYNWRDDPHTGFVAYSSMLFKTEKQTPERISDEAHDSDTLRIRFADGKKTKIDLDPPVKGLRIRDLTRRPNQASPVEWTLANEDRDPAHYADFAPVLGATNYDLRASYKVTILESTHKTGVSLYEFPPDGEYGDNIVAVSTIRQNIKKAKSVAEFVRFKYKTTAFFP